LLALLASLSACGANSIDNRDEDGLAERQAELRAPQCGNHSQYCAEVRRTSFGIPHIVAGNEKGLGFGLGYAFAQDNFCLLADDLVTVNGERSRYFGPGESYDSTGAGTLQNNLSSDFFFEWLNSPALVRTTLNRQPREIKDLAGGYAAGVNHYLKEVGSQGLPAACRGQAWVREMSDLDLIRLMRRYAVIASSGQFIDALFAAQPPGGVAALSSRQAAAARKPAGLPLAPGFVRERERARFGSNGVALGRHATESGAGLLLANPHFPWTTGARFYQLQLTIPGKLNAMGASLSGFPVVNIGFNENVAWTHTTDTSVHFNLFALQLDPADPTRYVVDGRKKTMTKLDLTVAARTPDGALASVEHAYYSSEFGPVVQWVDGVALALNDANLENDRMFQQWWAMNQVRSVAELKQSVEDTLGLPWVNVVASDRRGDAYYGDITPVPSVTDALASTCIAPEYQALLAHGLYVLSGNRSACRLKDDPAAPQRGIFGAANLPSLTRTDFVQNSNDSAWLTNPAQPLTGFPSIVSGDSYEQNGRTRLGISQINARLAGKDGFRGNKFNLESLQSIVLNNRSFYALLLLRDLNSACRGAGSITLDDGQQVDLHKGCSVLAKWDGTANLESIGWPLFRAWWGAIWATGVEVWKIPFDPADPVNTPRGLRLSDPSVVAATRAALATAMLGLDQLGVDYTKPWGKLQVAVRGEQRIPIHGGDGDQIYNAIASAPTGDGQLDVYYGSSALTVVSFEERLPKARGFLTYSQSSNPDSPFFADQTRRFSEKDWIDLPFSERAIHADPDYSSRLVSQ
jgi:acyl-homoserine-lactone acylase